MFSNGTDLPDIGEVVGPLLAQVPRRQQPLLVALAERLAAQRYREWAAAAELAEHRAGLLACADREEEIATRIEALDERAAVVQGELQVRFPEMGELNRSLFSNRSLSEQLTIQARGERLGAATWRAFAGEAAEQNARDTFLRCAELEEESAVLLEAIVQGG